MNTDTRRASSRAYHAKREAEGLKKVTLWLSPEARFKLDALKKAAGSKDKAANDAILAWSGPGAVTPPKPPAKPAPKAAPTTALAAVPLAGTFTSKPIPKKAKP